MEMSPRLHLMNNDFNTLAVELRIITMNFLMALQKDIKMQYPFI